MILHYITIHYATLHYITLHYTTLHYTILYYITLHYAILYYITLHYTILYYITLQYTILHYVALCCIVLWGEVGLGFPDLRSGQKPWWNWYWPVVNLCEVRKTQLAKSTFLAPCWCPWNHFRCFKVYSYTKEREREWSAESHGKLLHLFIPGKTAALVHEFAVEDLPRQNSSLGSGLGQNNDIYIYIIM